MIDMNQVLAKVMGGTLAPTERAPMPAGQHLPQASRQRIWPPSTNRDQTPAAATQNTGSGLLDQLGALGVGAAAGGLAGSLLGSRKMREVAGTVLQVGAVAAVGGLAYKAFQNYRQGKPVIPQGISDMLSANSSRSAVHPEAQVATETWVPDIQHSGETATLLLQAMIAAAAVDGRLDKIEYQRIQQQLLSSGFSGEEQLVLSQLIMHPSSIEELAAGAKTFEQRVEVYTAARLAIDNDAASEHDWLTRLANALDIRPELKAHIDAVGGNQQAEAA